MTRTRYAVVTLLALAGAAHAQDSVSRNANGGNGMPGDALGPWTSSNQRQAFIVDLTPFTTAWGTPLGVAPIIKSGKANAARFTSLNGAAVMSADIRTAASHPSATYALWTQPGGGVNTAENNAALNTTVSPSGPVTAFALGVMDYDEVLSGTTPVLANQLLGARVAFEPARPDRLYVVRHGVAVNSTSPTQLDRSQFGLGSVDASGYMVFRADGFGATGPATSVLVGDNCFRVLMPSRATNSNLIDNAGALDAGATDWIVVRHGVTHAAPSAIPASVAGRSVLLSAVFNGELRTEAAPNTTITTTAHRPGTTDQRGPASVTARPIFAPSVATGAVLSRGSGGGGKVDSISVFGLNANGGVTTARTLAMPAAISDPCDAFMWPIAGGGFRGYDGQVAFRGGVGPVAVGQDLQGRGLVAGVLYSGGTPNPANPTNAIVAARFVPPAGTAAWAVVAWVDAAAMTGKSILGDYGADGAPDTNDAGEGDGLVNATDAPIGRLAALTETSLGLTGPSMSSPAFDAAGNVYFIASAALRRFNGTAVVTETDLGVFRAVYNPATFCYGLDLVMRLGDVFAGRNAGRNYQVQGLNLADGDSASSATLSSGSTTQLPWNLTANGSLPQDAPQHLGGLALSARVVYDTNADGLYRDPTITGGDAASPDEAYNVVLYVGNITAPPAGCDPDFNCDGNSDQDAVGCLINVVAGNPGCECQDPDFNRDGNVDQDDVAALIGVVAGGPCP